MLGELLVENPPPEAALATAVVVVLPAVLLTTEFPLVVVPFDPPALVPQPDPRVDVRAVVPETLLEAV